MAGRGATWHENALVPITRNGVREDVYWTYSYGPIDDEGAPGGVGGVLVVCTETTEQVLNAARLSLSEERLHLALSGGRGIGTWDWDIPNDRVVADERFAKLYGVDPIRAASGAPIAEFFAGIHPDDLAPMQAAVAHDFNNLLQGIIGCLDLLQLRLKRGEADRVERLINDAQTSANRAAALTHRLLAFARRQPLDPKPVEINPLAASMEDLLRRTLGERIELDLELERDLWLTRCDAPQLESAILNLVINARDAMPEGGRLRIRTANLTLSPAAAQARGIPPGDYVQVAVSDTGVGMDPETLQRVFDPFFTTKPLGQGTGLGLSMIYGFARQSEGDVEIVSAVGQGATVLITLPRYIGQAASASAPVVDTDLVSPGRGTVALVEDEVVVRSLVSEVLQQLGYRVLEAGDGLSGLELMLSSEAIDLLVTDVGLPGLNGRQLADAARAARPGLPVLLMTGYAENTIQASGFLEQGMELIAKPFSLDELMTRIRAMMPAGAPAPLTIDSP